MKETETVYMGEVRAVHSALRPTSHWFSKGAMRFFNTRFPQTALKVGDEYWFVTSEQRPGDVRRYTFRIMRATGEIETPHGICAYASAYLAGKAMRETLIAERE